MALANHSLERTQPQRDFMYDVAVLRRSARGRWAASLLDGKVSDRQTGSTSRHALRMLNILYAQASSSPSTCLLRPRPGAPPSFPSTTVPTISGHVRLPPTERGGDSLGEQLDCQFVPG